MIVDHIKNIERYRGIDENVLKALSYIKEFASDPDKGDGKYEVVPGEIILHVITKETHDRIDAKMEIHKNFMDIHYLINGSERCYVSELPSMELIDYSEETDNGFWDCRDTGSVQIKEGEFYAVWPLEPHCPLCNAGDENKVIRKIIAKVKVKR
ncbi:protein, YhcH/YjgK/YiaL family [Lachnospiraceae bacterium JC7]|nr:protein, YhcH/YjgK/YiaL family [Lachnospiraceae bacterium JC7]